MKKEIVFMLININIGCTEKALFNIMDEMQKEDFNITILMLEEFEEFLE
jgi:hypothetical protein